MPTSLSCVALLTGSVKHFDAIAFFFFLGVILRNLKLDIPRC